MSHGYAINRRAPTDTTSIPPPSASETKLLSDDEPVSSDGKTLAPFNS
nr:5999_t:CDS:2 [Entrophospora candida]